jgi:hypothetical protein
MTPLYLLIPSPDQKTCRTIQLRTELWPHSYTDRTLVKHICVTAESFLIESPGSSIPSFQRRTQGCHEVGKQFQVERSAGAIDAGR